MSLDVSLYGASPAIVPTDGKIFIREDGATRELTLQEWQEKFPGTEPAVAHVHSDELYSANITHNLNRMAEAAGIYKHLWRPDEIEITTASELIEPLDAGLQKLSGDPEYYRTFNAPNGWGKYENLVDFVEKYLAACREYPDATVSVSR